MTIEKLNEANAINSRLKKLASDIGTLEHIREKLIDGDELSATINIEIFDEDGATVRNIKIDGTVNAVDKLVDSLDGLIVEEFNELQKQFNEL